MKTFALAQGDLVPAPGGYLLYTGAQKIYQDLNLAMREEYGGDSLHPAWGSILQEFVGMPLTAELRQQILSEINRVVNNYITVQNARIVQDNATGSVSKLTTDDVVQSVGPITVQSVYDSVVVGLILYTLSRQQLSLNQVIS